MALIELVEERRRAYGESRPASATVELLAPSGRGLSAWSADVRALGKANDGYRLADAGAQQLFRVLEDVTAPAPARVGAAVALAAQREPALQERVYQAARSSAEPRVRVALTQVANVASDDEAEAILKPFLPVTDRGRRW